MNRPRGRHTGAPNAPPGASPPHVEPDATERAGWFGSRPPAAGSLRAEFAEAARARVPFVLLDDQRSGAAELLTEPRRIIRADSDEQLPGALAELAAAVGDGATLYGCLAFDAAGAFDAALLSSLAAAELGARAPLLWFAEFGKRRAGQLSPAAVEPARVDFSPQISRGAYEAMVAAALERIAAGDIYQVNLTFPMLAEMSDPHRYYGAVRQRARAPYGAYLDFGDRRVLSFSPELFFAIDGRAIVARPMKGTRPRGGTPAADRRLRTALASSIKDRAENLMIVDLLRNDLSRVCMPGSVAVPRLFDVEAYPTVWQMTSTVAGRLVAGNGPSEALAALFPCGSITGAPKIEARRIIAELERYPRGIYTGAIGVIGPNRCAFNVAIRTIDHAAGIARLDVGAGIVADSRPRAEWHECLAKAGFASH